MSKEWDFEMMIEECVQNADSIVIDDTYKKFDELF